MVCSPARGGVKRCWIGVLLALAACGGEDPCDGEACADAAVAADARDDAASGDGPADAGFPDADPIDTGPPDLGVADAGTAFRETSCADCAGGCGLCVSTQEQSFCVDECASDLDGCLAGFSCVDIDRDMNQELFVCVPPGAICDQFGITFGTPCSGGTGLCAFDRTACQGDVMGMGYCTDACLDDRNCPAPYRCAPGDDGASVCLARFASDAERCAREGLEEERPCLWDPDCEGAVCVHAGPGQPGVCAPEAEEGSCAAGTTLRRHEAREVCVPERCACRGEHVAEGVRDLLAEALAAAGHTRCTALYEIRELIANPPDILHDPYRLSFFDPVLTEPWKAPGWARSAVGTLDDAALADRSVAYRAARVIEAQAILAERPAVRHAPEAIDPVAPLADAVARFVTAAGGAPDRAAIEADAADVPLDLQLAVATVVEGARQALLARRAAFAMVPAATVQQLYDYGPAFVVPRADGFGLSPANANIERLFNRDLRYGELFGGTADLLDAIDLAGLERFAVPAGTATVATSSASFVFSHDTPAGRIAIGGGENGIYDERATGFEGAWAVLIDLGGHDDYRIAAGGNVSAANGVSVVIDLGGDDRYGYVEVPHALDLPPRLPSDAGGRFTPLRPDQGTPISLSEVPRQGSGRAGIGVLVDLGAGSDHYQSLRMAQGSGIFGAGVLADDGGDDTYLAEVMAQGAAAFGIGLLLDLGGSDLRSAYQFAQGFAYARAVGVAYDVAGDDRWLLDAGDPMFGGDPLYPSAQRPTNSNASLGQGFGFGRRADFSDRAFMSGGIGVLVDAEGRDEYEGSVFAQGGGFWFGTGILADHRGADHYDGMWYAMASGAHYALGFLLDGDGSDTYGGRLPRVNVTLAGGHDFSAAFLIDEAGDDTYNGSRITLGSGNASGTGVFADNGGDDRYSVLSAFSLGAAGLLDAELARAGSTRRKIDTLGVFIDASGTDAYEQVGMAPVDARDDAVWLRSQSADPAVQATERGTAIDASEGDSTLHARW